MGCWAGVLLWLAPHGQLKEPYSFALFHLFARSWLRVSGFESLLFASVFMVGLFCLRRVCFVSCLRASSQGEGFPGGSSEVHFWFCCSHTFYLNVTIFNGLFFYYSLLLHNPKQPSQHPKQSKTPKTQIQNEARAKPHTTKKYEKEKGN